MEHSQGTQSRPSGIPRLSRLPVPKSTSIPAAPRPQLRASPSVDRLSKKPSSTALRKSPSVASITGKGSTTRNTPLSTPSKTAAVKDDWVFKKPIGRPPSRQARVQQQLVVSVGSDASSRRDDTLGALNGFRPSSRSSSRTGYRDDEDTVLLIDDNYEYDEAPKPRKSRPSLSDRTIETLSAIPPSPAARRRPSGFFNSDSPMRSLSRPSSALNSHSRPGTSDGNQLLRPETPSRQGPKPMLSTRNERTNLDATPTRRSVSAALPSSFSTTPRASLMKAAPTKQMLKPSTQTETRKVPRHSLTGIGSKTVVTRAPKPRPALGNAIGNGASSPALAGARKPSARLTAPAAPKDSPEATRNASNSSAALREQIARAKAARKTKQEPQISAPIDAGFDFGLSDDPFNQNPKGSTGLLGKRIDAARIDGRLNIAAMGLTEIPEAVMKMYEFDSSDQNTLSWGEVVDLVRLVAADNEIAMIPDEIFPDVDFDNVGTEYNDDQPAPQFGGIETLDLHGNTLHQLPLGLRRLQRLTTLNLSRNHLNNYAFDVISQISALRDLRIAENSLDGILPHTIGELKNLETLDLRGNQLSELPQTLQELKNLRILNVADNELRVLPAIVLNGLSLMELNVSKNSISGPMFVGGDISLPRLQTLDLSYNQINSFGDVELAFPCLQSLNISNNRLSAVPDLSPWTKLVSLLVQDNKLAELPTGFTSLKFLRSADFTGNNITRIELEVATMESLETLTLTANPLRERKHLTMSTGELKRALQSKLEPESVSDPSLDNASEFGSQDGPQGPTSKWTLRPSGLLDLSSQGISRLDEQEFTEFLANNQPRQIHFRHNKLETIPVCITQAVSLTTLDLSNNNITMLASEQLNFPSLRELRLAGNKITSFDELTAFLNAPNLEQLDLTYNRLSGSLPALRSHFPKLTVLIAVDNTISEISAAALEGLRVVDLGRNDISRLPPEIGLLAGTLTSLNVEGNRFRVPSYAILQKGTEATLTWLRDKIPEGDRSGC